MEWETGETPPGRVMSNLKTDGMRELLTQLVAEGTPAEGASRASVSRGHDGAGTERSAGSWWSTDHPAPGAVDPGPPCALVADR